MGWTQPVCGSCWTERRPDHPNPTRIREEYRERERCCYCGRGTLSGIYTRLDPSSVPYPAVDA